MCHGSIDPKYLMQDAEARLRAADAVREADGTSDGRVPPELMGGLGGVWARMAQVFVRRSTGLVRVHPAE